MTMDELREREAKLAAECLALQNEKDAKRAEHKAKRKEWDATRLQLKVSEMAGRPVQLQDA